MAQERRRAGAAHARLRAGAGAVVAASLLIALVLLPIGGRSPDWPVGNDALVLVGLLALGRFAITLAAWDTGGGFGLMGAAPRSDVRGRPSRRVLLLVLRAARAARRTAPICSR